MIEVRRLSAVGIILCLAAIVTCSNLWGDPGKDKDLQEYHKGGGTIKPATPAAAPEAEELSRFQGQPVSVYRTEKGENYAALQVQPGLADLPARPLDVLVLVDTSASKAEGPLALAQKVVEELQAKLSPRDRMALWTINIEPHDLSRGFKDTKSLASALQDLHKEVPLGAVNLKKGLTKAIDSFEGRTDRQQVILYLGDGKSVAGPVDVDDRAELSAKMVKQEIAFFAVPLGLRIDPQNLNSLVGGTGGKVIRLGAGETIEKIMPRMMTAFAEPIFYPTEVKLPASFTEVVPSKLPPLRRDSATLVLGKLKPEATLDYALAGKVAGREVRLNVSEKVPAAENDNFFLVAIHHQWMGRKELPALLPADRALGHAYKQNELACEDLLARAELALEAYKLDPAAQIFQQALQMDPHSARAKGGLALVEKMKSGKKSRKEMLEELKLNAAKSVTRVDKSGRKILVLAAEEERQDPEPGLDARDPAEDVKQRRAIADQQATQMVNEAIRTANRMARTNPDDAYDFLKRTREGIQGNNDLNAGTTALLATRLSRSMEGVSRVAAVIKRDQAETLALRAAADARLDLRRAETLSTDRIRERMRVFHNLMDQAREQEAYRQALAIRQDLVADGRQVPNSVTAGYLVGLNGYHLREVTELRRQREERWLNVLLEVDRSHVPFPDEPPVEYPSAALMKRMTHGQFDNWSDFSKMRMGRYSVSSFGVDMPAKAFELRDLLGKTVNFAGNDDPKLTLIEALDHLAKVYNVTFDVNERAFKYEMLNDVLKTAITEGAPLPALKTSLGTVLKKILARVPVPSGATYLIRRDVIEITTGQFATAEKAVRVYPVADLVIPIPNAVNQQSVQAQATILGLGAGAAGQIGGGLQLGLQIGGIQLGGIQLGGIQLGGIQLGGIQLGGIQLGGQLGGIQLGGQLGGQIGGAQLGQLGQPGFGFQGNVNLGVGGGLAGFGGGQLGQFGNLGGQFGLQGGDQSQLLITLIRQVVGRPKDWALAYNPVTGQPINPLLDDPGSDGSDSLSKENNNLGYYPPALALVVKAPSTIHSRASNLVITGAGAPGAGGDKMGFAPREEGKVLVDGVKPPVRVADAGAEKRDPKTIWQEALAKGVTQPGLIIATTEYLGMNKKFDHTSEFLKANLRQGVVVQPWVYRSLAIALRESGGSAEEIERAEVSAADLEPLDAQGYLQAARSLADDKHYDRALAFCKQAALLTPNLPYAYADAVRYAEQARDAKAMEWAVGNLLKQDWPVRNQEMQTLAAQKLESLTRLLEKEGRQADAVAMNKGVDRQKQRDLVVKLVWQGEADLDLKVEEPTGSICSVLQKQTINGGTLIGDSLSSMTTESYVAAQAFSGEYHVSVDRIWGKPLGNKAQLKVIRHQGTPEEAEELHTVVIDSNTSKPITIKLENGRRTSVAYVPTPESLLPPEDVAAPRSGTDAVLNRLRQLADPESTGFERSVGGGAGSPLSQPSASTRRRVEPSPNDRTLYQTKVGSFVQDAADVTAQAVISADRRSVRLSVSASFTGMTGLGGGKIVQVVNPIFPGGPPRGPWGP